MSHLSSLLSPPAAGRAQHDQCKWRRSSDFPAPGGPSTRLGTITSLAGQIQTYQDYPLFNLIASSTFLHPGDSGGPLLNLRTGRVCALVDSSRNERSDLGGFGIPVAEFLKQLPGLADRNRAHHQSDPTWDAAVEAVQP